MIANGDKVLPEFPTRLSGRDLSEHICLEVSLP